MEDVKKAEERKDLQEERQHTVQRRNGRLEPFKKKRWPDRLAELELHF
jgi:hypothetical protein